MSLPDAIKVQLGSNGYQAVCAVCGWESGHWDRLTNAEESGETHANNSPCVRFGFDTEGTPPPPVIRLQVPVTMLRALFPEGSQAEAELSKAVIGNYAREIAARIERRLEEQRALVVAEVARHFQEKPFTWSDRKQSILLDGATKEAVKLAASEALVNQVRAEVRAAMSDEAVMGAARKRVNEEIEHWVFKANVAGMVRAAIEAEIRAQLGCISLRDFIK